MAIGISSYASGVEPAGTAASGVTADTASSLLRTRMATATTLRFPVGTAETTIPVASTTGLTTDGAVVVDGECIAYTGLTETSLTGCVRGAFQQDGYGPPAEHDIGAEVVQQPLAANVRVLAEAVLALQARVEGLLVAVNVNGQEGTSYTLQASDWGRLVELANIDPVTVTVPMALPEGFRCRLTQALAGKVTVSAAGGVAINNRQGHSKTAGQHAVVELVQTFPNVYLLVGDTGT